LSTGPNSKASLTLKTLSTVCALCTCVGGKSFWTCHTLNTLSTGPDRKTSQTFCTSYTLCTCVGGLT
jgi:hypothetical protein